MKQAKGVEVQASIYAFIVARFFADGWEIFFILPTGWYYTKSYGQTKEYLVLLLISANLSNFIMMPLIGRMADRFGKVKLATNIPHPCIQCYGKLNI